jgi:beta-glucosidase
MRIPVPALLLCFVAVLASAQTAARTPEQRAHDLVSRMTLEEKAAQSMNSAPAIPRLNLPAYDYWSEGLHGIARSGYATLFPQAIGMAATWDAPLLKQVGEVVSTEARAKYNEAVRNNIHSIFFGLTIWSPNINIFRDPRWGRGQETYGEDPYLTATLGMNFIQGLQGPDPQHPRVIATPKHFAVHSGPESQRHSFDVEPSPHDLWETYLPQFRAAIVDAHAGSIMCSYNALNGTPACGSDLLLKTILRDDWKFSGFVTSDCGAVDDFFEKKAHASSPDKEHAAATALLAGTDSNCGDTYSALPKAVHAGLLKELDIDTALVRVLAARFRMGLFDPPASVPYAQIPFSENRSPAHQATALKTSEESMVLLKNDGLLPLPQGRYKTIAVVGPNAASLSALEGNYNAIPKDPEMPIDALRKAFPGANVLYAQGAPHVDGVPITVPRTMFRPALDSNTLGLHAEFFAINSTDLPGSFNGTPVATRTDSEIDFDWSSAAPVPAVQQQAFAVRWTGFILPPQAGDFAFNIRLGHCSPCLDHETFVIKLDGKEVSSYVTDEANYRFGRRPALHVNFADTKPHAFEIDYTHQAPLFGAGITFEWMPPPGLLQKQAVDLARQADLVVAMLGLSPELEGEELHLQVEGFAGGDRTDLKLPASQSQLLEGLATLGKPIVAVLLNGSALAVPFTQQHANAILEAWYPGEFGGKAIASTLTGSYNPAGRLPVTFYASVADLPPFTDYSMKKRTYRYFNGVPEYSFGYGLSYARFTYAELKLSTPSLRAGDTLTAEVSVTNTSTIAGDEVAQLYLIPPPSGNGGLSPRLQLESFQRIHLNPGETRKLTFIVTPRQISEVAADGTRSVQPGQYQVSVGGSQPNDPNATTRPLTIDFQIKGLQPLPH